MKIAIVNPVKIAADFLKCMLLQTGRFQVAWIAYNGEEAVKKSASDLPDLILMDLLGSEREGLEAISGIMRNNPCSILILTSSIDENVAQIFESMGYGALDVVNVPPIEYLMNHPHAIGDLLQKIETIACLLGKGDKVLKEGERKKVVGKISAKARLPTLLLMGASTGGPLALAKILSKFPPNTPLATIIIQHVDERFAHGLAQWLEAQCSFPVQLASDGSRPLEGTVLLAARNWHLVMTRNRDLKYVKHPSENPYSPSIDVFFQSVVQHWPEKALAVLLTGMGSDGAKGLKLLHDAGWHTIVQHEQSCVVYGMPKAAIQAGAASEVLDLDEIAPAILSVVLSE